MGYKEILLIEDNETDAELAIRALRKVDANHHITHLEDGAEALDYLFPKTEKEAAGTLPKLILLDIKLPKVNGLEVLKAIKKSTSIHSIPVIMLTSSKELADIQDAYALGANSYIVKPVEFEKFQDALKTLGHYWMWVNQAPILK